MALPPAVHQLVPRLEPLDATGNHALLLQEGLRMSGRRSEIFVQETVDATRRLARPVQELDQIVQPDDVLIYQFSTASALAETLWRRSERLVLVFHNLTPPQLYRAWDPAVAAGIEIAERQLTLLAPRARLGIADSSFNAVGLSSAGCPRVEVIPVLFDAARGGSAAEPELAGELSEHRRQGTQWLFVGRAVPPKAQHRVVMALWAYRQLYDPLAELHLVGATGHPLYQVALEGLIGELKLHQAVHLAGSVGDQELLAYYKGCDVFVSLSEHEGFGIPLVEAMSAGLPVVAAPAGAIPETVGDAALLLADTSCAAVAAAVRRVVNDRHLNAEMVARGERQADRFALEKTLEQELAILTQLAA